ncbi:unnamed protein product (macronuclear) [Paramecium tetraurelia]|uniref:Uncharacterized protein n=1 Tax=Paramecium tetraurelia TaxID=5888 RepID=A0EID7_PARTE|nr:uncharacterized protein GSPATT00027407001 [Paramecium tetraurelia]CAK95078.1 unnamed protein product [Paramecium tetraurelia]|eukprot:XP_001462451.1 hypothetical protein (macronuclear) [Paramecium tetraurelia strain d4-2]
MVRTNLPLFQVHLESNINVSHFSGGILSTLQTLYNPQLLLIHQQTLTRSKDSPLFCIASPYVQAVPIPLYYFIDLAISIFEGSLFEPCRFCLWYHHVVQQLNYNQISIIVVTAIILRKEYEWQDTMIMATHTLLMKYPFIFVLNIIYVALVTYYDYYSPLREKWINRFLGKFFPFIYYSFIIALIYDCTNALPFLY